MGLVMIGMLGSAGSVMAKHPAKGKTAVKAAAYICTKDRIGSEKPGNCPICKEEMRKAGAYVCPRCDTTSDKPGKCSCGKRYIKTALAGMKCPGCGYYIPKDVHGCPVCKYMQKHKGKKA